MTMEVATAFPCEGDTLVGVLGLPDRARDTGVVILVGGPQYRVGSHRQFVSLARHLTDGGIATLRFDFRGMGDSTGSPQGFEDVDTDIRAAIDHFMQQAPSVRRIVLWGLCDAASAAMMYAPADSRIAGLVLANPWARSAESYAKTLLVHYYLSRLLSREFWVRLASRQLNLKKSTSELVGNVVASAKALERGVDYRARMARGLERFEGRALFLFSGNDLTCREFEAYAEGNMRGVLDGRKDRDETIQFPRADHTFSTVQAGHECAIRTLKWLHSAFPCDRSQSRPGKESRNEDRHT